MPQDDIEPTAQVAADPVASAAPELVAPSAVEAAVSAPVIPVAAVDINTPTVAATNAAPAPEPEDDDAPEPEVLAEAVVEADKPKDKPEAEATLLETPAEKKPEPEKPAEEAKVEEPAPRVYEAFKLPEDIKIEEKALDNFRDIAGKAQLDQDTAQRFLDMHIDTLNQYAQAIAQKQRDDFAETVKKWEDRTRNDPYLGKAAFQTNLQAAARMRDLLVPDQFREEYRELCRDTGAGNHPALMRIFVNAARLFDEPAAPPVAAVPTPDRGGAAKKGFKQSMYDHPESQRVRASR
jgi:hypothetical protein